MKRPNLALAAGVAVAGLLAPLSVATAATPSPAASASRQAPLTNLDHLDFLTTQVAPPSQPGHTTYQLAGHPDIGVLWVYANHQSNGGYQRTGGGTYDASTDTYGQGAYDADDIARAAVVYLRHWQQWQDTHSRDEAEALLRGLTYLQTSTGPNAGNIVLWMQPDGRLNPTPTPPDSPNPSDTGPSYWLARTIWALGEGYSDFRKSDPGFANFLAGRLNLAVDALNRQDLTHYGKYQTVNGVRLPAWLISDGADASSEAVLGLTAYVAAGGSSPARTALVQLADGIAAMGAGNARTWPYGALLPWSLSPSQWHAWGDEMATALAQASGVLRDPALLRPAVADAAVFAPHLLTATGPDNGWSPTPVDGSQIAYGADSVVRSLLAVANATHSSGLRQLAGVAAGWFFGQNPAGVPMYDPATGVTFDGVASNATVNQNSGAESTIHGLLTMEALDAAPDVANTARSAAHIARREGQQTIEANQATLSGGARAVEPPSPWTGEAQWSSTTYVSSPAGSRLTWQVPASDQPRMVQPVAYLVDGGAAQTVFTSSNTRLGTLHYGSGGAQGASAAPGALLPVTLPAPLPASARSITGMTAGGTGLLDSLLLTPLVSQLITTGDGHTVALLSSVATTRRTCDIAVPGTGQAVAVSYDQYGIARERSVTSFGRANATILPGGFTLVTR
ncbi:hypothetical protein NGB36_09890 [Streptomyces sp. RB6PN25]|uniref:Uncharacterized protein n=1 Tax=Streptomyces humicola TaxID=2953240 RepID=A0ABT1PUT4_9ACTN|nr:hypothetical protein [Streptomyces humicola]MCQ4080903.1 hypothetical protein [Streptomyces humicola]